MKSLEQPLRVFPWQEWVYEAGISAEAEEAAAGSGSTSDYLKQAADSSTLAYTLRNGETYPYAGLYFSTRFNIFLTGLSGYECMKFKLAASIRDAYQITSNTWPAGYTIEGDTNTRCPLEKPMVSWKTI